MLLHIAMKSVVYFYLLIFYISISLKIVFILGQLNSVDFMIKLNGVLDTFENRKMPPLWFALANKLTNSTWKTNAQFHTRNNKIFVTYLICHIKLDESLTKVQLFQYIWIWKTHHITFSITGHCLTLNIFITNWLKNDTFNFREEQCF